MTSDPGTQSRRDGLKSLWHLIVATTMVVTAFAIYGPVIAVSLQHRGLSVASIGAFAMISFTTIGLMIPLMPSLFAKFGLGRVYKVGLLFNLVCLIGYASTSALAWWCLAAVVGGVGGAAIWNATEALLAEHAPPEQRGFVMGVYQTVLGGALAAGPLAPAALKLSATQALWLAVAFSGAGLVFVMLSKPKLLSAQPKQTALAANPASPRRAMNTWNAMCAVPSLVVIAIAGGIFEAGLSSISAAHGSKIGFTLAAASSLVAAIGVGSLLAQYPAGLLADRVAPQKLFTISALSLLTSCFILLGSLQWNILLWFVAIVWGAVGGALYTLSMIAVAHKFRAIDIAAGTASMILGYTVGGAVGPIAAGFALDIAGIIGLALWLGLVSCALLVAGMNQAGHNHAAPRTPDESPC